MDKSLLVKSGHALVDLLEANGVRPSAAMWVRGADIDAWRLWIVPPENFQDKRDFYRRVSEIVSNNPDRFQGFDASYVEMVSSGHPAVSALRRMFRVEGQGDVSIQSNMLNGFYLPDGIILRMDFEQVKRVG
ncbi:hypothetical protein [Bosea vaviloviae]|uniref:hypothetical protein n=1 Tax=Bosea vaviloviae TaxID=1526658 RepID=UPI0012E29D6A|nr:hypothetical protein [Bosea vaviloviae]